MIFLSLFFLAGLDRAITPKSQQTIGKNVRFGLTKREVDYYTGFMGNDKTKKVKPIRLEEYFK